MGSIGAVGRKKHEKARFRRAGQKRKIKRARWWSKKKKRGLTTEHHNNPTQENYELG